MGQPGSPTIRGFARWRCASRNGRPSTRSSRSGRARDRWETTRELRRRSGGVPAAQQQDLAENEHLRDRGFLVALEHAEVGRRIRAGVPWTMSRTPTKVRKPAPLRAADTDSVLQDLLGYSPGEIERLRAAGVLT
jgi:crotonobetainyl-CoA:carnitine CoA-transferase CaiB-like acyl-CoA transferase